MTETTPDEHPHNQPGAEPAPLPPRPAALADPWPDLVILPRLLARALPVLHNADSEPPR
ncbi:hypothetical protein ACIBCM_14930 [Streptomyces sp. NPDC051018]|uniref:hypothetical protein n=1 Tax=Streptomyces sp. NPDC051018 TaxID=3365639 RepID=UPI0037BE1578